MKHSLCLGVIYLLIAISSVHSASYLYRYGREVVVPSVNDEVKEIVSELKKDEPVNVVELIAVPSLVPVVSGIIDQAVAVKNVPASVVSAAENVPTLENNLIAVADDVRADAVAANAAVQPVVPSQVVSEEARAKSNPAIRFDELEVIQPGSGKSEKVQTVADTVKSAAVQAIEKQNEEVEKAKPVEPVKEVVPVKEVEPVPVVKAVPEVEAAQPVKSIDVVKEPEQPVVPAVKDDSVVAPVAAVPNVEVEKLVESVRSAEPEPVKKVEVQDQKVQVVKTEPENVEPVPSSPERQESAGANPPNQPPNPLNQIQTTLNQITTNFQNAISGIIANSPFGGNRPQSDTQAPANGGLNTNEIASNAANPAPAPAAPSPTTSAPNLLANVINNFNNLATSILPRPTTAPAAEAAAPQQAQTGTRGDQATQSVAQATTQAPNLISNIATNVQNALNNIATGLFQRTTAATTAAPVASSPGPSVVKGTRVDEDEGVEVVQNIDIVNDKIDLTKKGQ